jgi:hypothetical protein
MSPDFSFSRGFPESPTYLSEEQDEFGFDHSKLMSNSHFSNQYDTGMGGNGIDPNSLNINMNNGFNPNTSQGFGMGSGAIQDDDLDFLAQEDVGSNQQFFQNSNGIPSNVNMFSHTPAEAPIVSPFNRGFNYNQYNVPLQTDFQRVKLERNPSDSRAPLTPKTPALGNLHIGTPESLNQLQLNQQLNHQARMTANGWNGTPGSNQSFLDSPLASPHGPFHQPGISEVMHQRASVPTKLEGGHGHSSSLPLVVSQEAKKKRRRESHNLVERRRRDNINERIQDLSKLVPSHRLEDEKVRKHITANGPLSPHGVSPPSAGFASSGLAPANGRRAAAGTITQGLPQEEKEKGPNKGDILNGAVAWMRDLMWYAYKMQEEKERLQHYIEQNGASVATELTEEDIRMSSELNHIMQRTGPQNFSYTRAHGTHLRVPGFTNYAGEPMSGDGVKMEDADLWLNSGGDSGRNSMSIKEEDEDLSMDMA